MFIHVCPLPAALLPRHIDQAAFCVIDTLRMTSVAITALTNGCAALRPACEVEEARALSADHQALLGGERGALRIEGFDFSNSPLEYTPERVAGRRLVITTSNGTRAVLACGNSRQVLLAAFINADAVARALGDAGHVCLLCAGTNGLFSLEDSLTAGAIIARLPQASLDDMAQASLRLYQQSRGDLCKALETTDHYQRLKALGFGADLAYCLKEDSHDCVPRLCPDSWFRA